MPRTRLFCAALLALGAAPAAAGDDIERLAWLAGCWQGASGDPGTVEHWLPPAGGTMLGMSRTVRQGRTAEFEFMQLRQLPDGALAFIPQPAGRPPTTFRLLRQAEREAVFENRELDFPRTIAYRRPEPARLVATLEGTRDGAPRRAEFVFARASCDAPGDTTQRP